MSLPAVVGPRELKRAERFYTRLRSRASRWLERHRVRGKLHDYVLLLPDLFAMLLRLIRDPRVDAALKAQLLLVSAYVISPLDLVPDFLLPVGLADDTVAVAFVLSRVAVMMGQAGPAVLREHWDGNGEALAQIERLISGADAVLHRRILGKLRRRFGRG